MHVRVSGRVQGVGFRDWLRHEALCEDVVGWVRNRSDGTVEAVLQGETEAVERLLGRMRRGPPAARVMALEAGPAPAEHVRPYHGFERLPSA